VTEDKLLKKAGRGDEAAFLLLYERHRDGLYRFLYRLLGSAELAEDLTHDCFLSLIRQPERFDPKRASLRTYLYAAGRNLALKHFRQTGHEMVLDEAQETLPGLDRHEPLRQLLEEELVSKVRQAIAQLPPLQREALILFEYEGLSLAEIAAVVEADVGTVKARLHRGRERLRRLLAPYFKSGLFLASVEVY
jgi:RNA polymerase sigma-70 factor (ECF subfamily)